jgi:hypothetical protein
VSLLGRDGQVWNKGSPVDQGGGGGAPRICCRVVVDILVGDVNKGRTARDERGAHTC